MATTRDLDAAFNSNLHDVCNKWNYKKDGDILFTDGEMALFDWARAPSCLRNIIAPGARKLRLQLPAVTVEIPERKHPTGQQMQRCLKRSRDEVVAAEQMLELSSLSSLSRVC